jgi:DNA-binding CsgD family transcriptional regulator
MSEIRIARELGIKLDLVRYYKKSIYKRFFTSSMNEAVYIAMKSGLI